MRLFLFSVLLLVFCAGCQQNTTLFERLESSKTGLTFSNTITESDSINAVKFEYAYNGGGVGVGDFNNDGWQDVFFSGNQVPSKLYLNQAAKQQGALRFEDVTDASGIKTPHWNTGVSVVDINQDGLLDIYVCTIHPSRSQSAPNQLFLNTGIDKNGVPHFREMAAEIGLADRSYSTQAVFFDYDLDGDLDCYLLNNALELFNRALPMGQRTDGTGKSQDQLFRNDGPLGFINVSKQAGIQTEGWGLGVAVVDFNQDGWPDVYCANDFQSNDLMWINNKNGTFTNRITESLRHQSSNSMGCDVMDINHDGRPEIMNVDMMPEDNLRQKTMFSKPNYDFFQMALRSHYQPQYVRNSLQLNRGSLPDGLPVYSEIGQLAGVYATDWSWAPLFADFDNDGERDLLITNGYRKDVTNLDFVSYTNRQVESYFSDNKETAKQQAVKQKDMEDLLGVKKSNVLFRNLGNLQFEDVTAQWGLKIPSFSNGAAYADFDNDGDLDIVVNNIDDEAFLFKNKANDNQSAPMGNYLRVKLIGQSPNLQGIGAKLTAYYGGTQQYFDHSVFRGYKSSVEPFLHFGLGKNTQLDSLEVRWLDGRKQVLKNIKANQTISLNQANALAVRAATPKPPAQPYMVDATSQMNINYVHSEEDFADFKYTSLLPHQHSQSGPAIAVADINGDKLDDFVVGGSAHRSAAIFVQRATGGFIKSFLEPDTTKAKIAEDMGLLLFDADNDGDNDLYAVRGSSEFGTNVQHYQDRLYLNDGHGRFTLTVSALPKIKASGSCVVANDFDHDGDLDLFVGGRVTPFGYPQAPRSYLLRNDSRQRKTAQFTDITPADLQHVGMITAALWTDYDNDGWADLALVGEFMKPTFFKNTNGKLNAPLNHSITQNATLVGWYNSISGGDFDNDGDVDYVLGNRGLNSQLKASPKEPLSVYAKDFDQSGTFDPILSRYVQGKEVVSGYRDALTDQLVMMKKKMTSYEAFGKATFADLFTKDLLKDALILRATQMASIYLQNNGNGQFETKLLPLEAQFAPIFGTFPTDLNNDGNLDLLAVGNSYATETNVGQYDAHVGLCLLGNGRGDFQAAALAKSGLLVRGDAKALAQLKLASGAPLWLVSQNKGKVLAFRPTQLPKPPPPRRKTERYWGSGYLSQSAH